MIRYEKMNLFDAPKGSVLVHACNAKGVWGAGIAKEFKARFPKAYSSYRFWCGEMNVVGEGLLVQADPYWIGCLVTSNDYGKRVDPPELVLKNTDMAIADLLARMSAAGVNAPVYSNTFNSGLFGVPWAHSEDLLRKHLGSYKNITWTVAIYG